MTWQQSTIYLLIVILGYIHDVTFFIGNKEILNATLRSITGQTLYDSKFTFHEVISSATSFHMKMVVIVIVDQTKVNTISRYGA